MNLCEAYLNFTIVDYLGKMIIVLYMKGEDK